MNMDSIVSVYSDTRTEYTKQLCIFLVPAFFRFFTDLLEKARQSMVVEPKKSLWQFQNYLNEIHDWNMEKVNTEIHNIYTNCGCDYLEDLITMVFIAHTKVLTAIRLVGKNKNRVQIVVITDSNPSANAATFNFTIPRGDQGLPGSNAQVYNQAPTPVGMNQGAIWIVPLVGGLMMLLPSMF
jgi:hypothetical protein